MTKKCYILSGPNGAGKTTLANNAILIAQRQAKWQNSRIEYVVPGVDTGPDYNAGRDRSKPFDK